MPILKHADFEVPALREFKTVSMASAFSQPAGASPPCLPGEHVLRIDLTGQLGAIIQDMGTGQAVLYTRMMIATGNAIGGTLNIAGGFASGGAPLWQIRLDAASQSITLNAGSAQLSVDLPAALGWHTVEVGLDTSSGIATLRLNGIERASSALSIAATRYVWLGGASASAGLSGHVDVDHWVISTQPIGLPIAEAAHDHAGDPRRWLVVYNRALPDSETWADAYRQRRGVPYTNLCGLDLPTYESVTPAEYETIRQQITAYLSDNQLTDQIVGILLGYGVPGYSDIVGVGALTAISSYLQTNDTHGSTVINPLYQDPVANRPSASDYSSARLTGRVDAPDLAGALALLDRADAVSDQPLTHESGGRVVVDINPDNPNVGPVYTGLVGDWANGKGLASLRLPATIYDATPPDSVSDDALVWGWRDAAPPSGFFEQPGGRRAVCMQFDPEAVLANSVRSASDTDWLNQALQAGYASAAAPSRVYSLSSIPLPHLVFEALRRGWTIAEAWMVSQSFLRGGLQLVGDPLMTISFPKAGYDVFGPVDRLDQIDFDQPLALRHAGQTSLDLTPQDAPVSGSSARYLVQRYDDEGRPDFASTAIHVALEQGSVLTPALPAWPSFEGWRVNARNARLVLVAVWPASLRVMQVDRVELYAQSDGQGPALADSYAPATGDKRVVFDLDPPDELTRYRFRVVQGPTGFDTPWSQWVSPTPAATQPLTLLEASS